MKAFLYSLLVGNCAIPSVGPAPGVVILPTRSLESMVSTVRGGAWRDLKNIPKSLAGLGPDQAHGRGREINHVRGQGTLRDACQCDAIFVDDCTIKPSTSPVGTAAQQEYGHEELLHCIYISPWQFNPGAILWVAPFDYNQRERICFSTDWIQMESCKQALHRCKYFQFTSPSTHRQAIHDPPHNISRIMSHCPRSISISSGVPNSSCSSSVAGRC
jgi:hypothetical protein